MLPLSANVFICLWCWNNVLRDTKYFGEVAGNTTNYSEHKPAAILALRPMDGLCLDAVSKQQTNVENNLYISVVNPTKCTNISIYFTLNNTLQVSDGLSLHHQKIKTVHRPTATSICQTDTADYLIAFPLASSQQLCLTYACCYMYSLELMVVNGKTVRNV